MVGPESNLKASSRKLLASSQEMKAFGPETFGLVPFTLAKEIAKFYSGKEIERGRKHTDMRVPFEHANERANDMSGAHKGRRCIRTKAVRPD